MNWTIISEIAKAVHISLLDIVKIIRRFTDDQIDTDQITKSTFSKDFQMFIENSSWPILTKVGV